MWFKFPDKVIKIAMYGAVVSVSGSAVMYYLIHRKLVHSQYYTLTVEALSEHERACRVLGKPIKVRYLDLSNKVNRITETNAQVLIPVYGSRTAGHIRSTAVHHGGRWNLEHVQLELKGRNDIVVILDQKHQPHNDTSNSIG